MKNRIVSLVLTAALTLSIGINALAYSDAEGHWAEKSIERWSAADVVDGYAATKTEEAAFKPEQALTRGELAVALDEALEWKEISVNIFDDLKYAADGTT